MRSRGSLRTHRVTRIYQALEDFVGFECGEDENSENDGLHNNKGGFVEVSGVRLSVGELRWEIYPLSPHPLLPS